MPGKLNLCTSLVKLAADGVDGEEDLPNQQPELQGAQLRVVTGILQLDGHITDVYLSSVSCSAYQYG